VADHRIYLILFLGSADLATSVATLPQASICTANRGDARPHVAVICTVSGPEMGLLVETHFPGGAVSPSGRAALGVKGVVVVETFAPHGRTSVLHSAKRWAGRGTGL
jgi:hypothetical protein